MLYVLVSPGFGSNSPAAHRVRKSVSMLPESKSLAPLWFRRGPAQSMRSFAPCVELDGRLTGDWNWNFGISVIVAWVADDVSCSAHLRG